LSIRNKLAAMSATQAGPAWLVLPTYNEAENLEPLVEAVRAKLPGGAQVLVVDDNSPDGTGQIAERLAGRHANVNVLHRPRKEGLGPAYISGFREALGAGAGLVLEMDSDFSHDPAYLPRLLEAATRADVVLGSRYVAGGGVSDWGPLRRAISRGGSAYARLVLGVDVHDLTGGFKCFRREVLEAIDLDRISTRGYAFQVEITYRALRLGFSVAEVPIVFRERRVGKSKMDLSIVAEAVWRLPLLRFGRGRIEQGPSPAGSTSGQVVGQFEIPTKRR
jgi:dolichol-phosphate mannosyltransferase